MALRRLFIIAILGFIVQCNASVGDLSNYTISCWGAKETNSSFLGVSSYCHGVVHWTSANLFDNRYYSHLSPGAPLGIVEQDQVARNTAQTLLAGATSTISEQCARSLQWFACLQSFPFCPLSGEYITSGTAFLPACDIHCQQVEDHCHLPRAYLDLLHCGSQSGRINRRERHKYALDTANAALWKERENKNCLTFVPSDNVFLPPERGPYSDLPIFYTVMISFWTFVACVWIYFCSVWRNSPNPALLRLIGVILCMRVGLAVISRQMWLKCNELTYYCPSSSINNAVAGFRVFEAAQFFCLFIMGKGWTITKPLLTSTEWFMAMAVTALFLFASFSFGPVSSSAPSQTWVIYTSVVYSYMFVQFLGLVWVESKLLKGQIKRFNPDMPVERTSPIIMKWKMYEGFFVGGLGLLVLEFICQVQLYMLQDIRTICAVYEVGSLFFLSYVAFVFRPRDLSPFFYMFPASNVHREQQQDDLPRALSIVSVKNSLYSLNKKEESSDANATERTVISHKSDPSMDEFELELAPLLTGSARGRDQHANSSVVVLNRDDGFMSVCVRVVEPRVEEDEFAILDRFPLFTNPNRIVPGNFIV